MSDLMSGVWESHWWVTPFTSAHNYSVFSPPSSPPLTLPRLLRHQYELATGRFPYPKWNSVFDQLTQVVKGEPPQLCSSDDRQFSLKFISFVNLW